MAVRNAMGMRALPILLVAGLTACDGPPRQTAGSQPNASTPAQNATSVQEAPLPVPAAAPGDDAASAEPRACAAEIGAAAAARRVKICRDVSPATHPPCNAANSCAMIEDEIARSCALFDGKGPAKPGCRPAPKSMEAAAAVVKRYYAALDARDYGTAWQQWGDNGPPNQTPASFKAGFASTRSTRVTIGPLQPGDAGAGSIYQPVPVTVDAMLTDGTHQRFTGDYVVRRVNDVDGASAGQLRWHIGSAKLRAVTER